MKCPLPHSGAPSAPGRRSGILVGAFGRRMILFVPLCGLRVAVPVAVAASRVRCVSVFCVCAAMQNASAVRLPCSGHVAAFPSSFLFFQAGDVGVSADAVMARAHSTLRRPPAAS